MNAENPDSLVQCPGATRCSFNVSCSSPATRSISAGGVPVPVRDHHRIEPAEIHAKLLDVSSKDRRVVARVEQDATAAIFDERRKTPVLLQGRRTAEGVVENGDPRRLLRVGVHRNQHCERDTDGGDERLHGAES